MYVQSVFDDSVRAPHTRMPRVPNGRMQLIPIGLSRPCSALVMLISTSSAPRTTSLAGAFHTPRVVVGAGPDAGQVTARRDHDLGVAVGRRRVA